MPIVYPPCSYSHCGLRLFVFYEGTCNGECGNAPVDWLAQARMGLPTSPPLIWPLLSCQGCLRCCRLAKQPCHCSPVLSLQPSSTPGSSQLHFWFSDKVYYSKVSDWALIWWETLTGLSAYCRGYVCSVSSVPFQISGTWILRSCNKGSVPGTWCLPCLRPAVHYLIEKSNLTSVANSGFPCGSAGKESTCNVGDPGLIPGLGKSPGEGKGYPSSILAWRIPWTI